MAATYPDHQVLQLDYVAALLAQLRFPAVSLAIIIHPESRGEQAPRQKVPRRVNRSTRYHATALEVLLGKETPRVGRPVHGSIEFHAMESWNFASDAVAQRPHSHMGASSQNSHSRACQQVVEPSR